MVERTIQINNPTGLHARPASLFVQTAGKFTSNIWIIKDGRNVNGKSIMGIMSIAASKGDIITINVDGDDENEAIKELVELIKSNFGEEF